MKDSTRNLFELAADIAPVTHCAAPPTVSEPTLVTVNSLPLINSPFVVSVVLA